MNSYIITKGSITIVIDGVPEVVSASHPNYDRVAKALTNDDWPRVQQLINAGPDIQRLADGAFQIHNDEVLFQGETIPATLANNIVEQYAKNYDISPMLNFFKKLKENPRQSIVNELYDFITNAQSITLHRDGDILAYKLVREDYRDIYSGKIDNSVGQTLPRLTWDAVDYNRHNTCSKGYHFCSAGYLPHYGCSSSRVVIVKINPADIVAIPVDYQFAKGRALTYEIIGEVPRETAATFFEMTGSVLPDDAFEEDDLDDLDDPDEDDFGVLEDLGLAGVFIVNFDDLLRG